MPTLLLCGDVMTGRGVDQILPNAGDARLEEPSVDDARTYVELAEGTNGRSRGRSRSRTRGEKPWRSPSGSEPTPASSISRRASPGASCDGRARVGLGEIEARAGYMHPRPSERLDRIDEPRRHPAVVELAGGGRIAVIAFGTEESGIPRS